MTDTIYGVLATAYRPDACPECGKVKILWDSRGTCLNKWHDSAPPTQGATPETDAFPTRVLEREIDAALNPKGMSVHSGKMTVACDHVAYVINRSRNIERQRNALRAENERLRKELDEARK